uniref:Uncharacterized protein n=1 Tax=Oryza meridionalis TaxID=40149 RepID=A0A0E0C3N8_9ORYZ
MATSLTLIATPCTAPRSSSTSPRSRPWRREGNHAAIGSGTCRRRQRRHDDEAVCLDQHPPRTLRRRPNGTYIRNGPGMWDVGEHAFHHLFDGYATLVRVSFRGRSGGGARATGAHRQIESEAYRAAVARGRPVLREFSHCPAPAKSLLDRVGDLVGLVTGAALTDNPNSAVLPLGDGRTTKSSVLIDPDTLETVGRFRYTDRLGGMVQSAHPIVTDTEFLTLLPDLVRPGHLVVRMEAGSNERKVIGRVDCRGGPSPGWLHSFAVTEKYVVVPEMPLRYSSASLLTSELAPFYAFDWVPASGSYMHVMCKSTGKTVASVEVPPFMAIHFINAYEEEGDEAAVVVDCCEHYGNPAIIETLVLNRLRSLRGKDVLPNARVGRFRIPLDGSPFGELETALDPEEHGRGMDMCSINPARLGRKYRYAYACGARRPCNFPNTLTKIDLVEKKAKSWHEEGSVPSEPFFVARTGATDEDDGVVISVVSSDDGEGYALVLDATTFEEISRVRFPYGLPYGFHGCWIPGTE